MPKPPLPLLLLLAAACASAPDEAVSAEGEPLPIPHFEPDDPRIGTAGFVRETLRLERDVGGTTYTQMAFAVGSTVTLGAMVEGRFDGTATWTLGRRSFSVPVRRSDRGSASVPVEGEVGLVGQHGSFNAFDWVNVDVPDAWLTEDGSVSLRFRGEGVDVRFPLGGAGYRPASVPG